MQAKILRIHPSYEELIVSLKSAKNKPNNPYSLNRLLAHITIYWVRLNYLYAVCVLGIDYPIDRAPKWH
jgi:hypothetical protein